MKRNKRKLADIAVAVIILAAAVFFAVRYISFRPKDKDKSNADGKSISVVMTIDFSAVYEEKNYPKLSEGLKAEGVLSSDGYMVENEQIELTEGQTVLDALEICCEENEIQLSCQSPEQNAFHTAYVEGIGGLYEGDCTKRSGWVYTVDGNSVNVGMSEKKLSGGEEIIVSFIVY